MKNKKANYVLLLLVLIVWGIVFYRIFGYVGQESTQSPNSPGIIAEPTKLFPDTFHLVANYRDPFLGSFPIHEIQIANNLTPKPPPVVVPWPVIIYTGIIRSKKYPEGLVILQINGKEKSLKPGEVVSGLKLLKVFRDSVEIEFGKEKKFFRK